MSSYKKQFQEKNYVLVKNLVPKEQCRLASDFLKLTSLFLQSNLGYVEGDEQVPNSEYAASSNPVAETLLFSVLGKIEKITGKSLYPTYSYSRIYVPGNVLKKHKDRPSCEISATVLLRETDGYNWPIYMGGEKVILGQGDAVIYRGCDIAHWRQKCKGPKGYNLSQTFLHYVDKEGECGSFKYDGSEEREKLHSKFLEVQ